MKKLKFSGIAIYKEKYFERFRINTVYQIVDFEQNCDFLPFSNF